LYGTELMLERPLLTPDQVTAVHERVLIVEDNAVIALGMREVLSQAGFDVVGTAATVGEALRVAADTCPDIAIMDVTLAGRRDGIEGALLLRQGSRLPVLFLTGQDDLVTRLRAASAQPAAYLLKPVSGERLVNAVRCALQTNAGRAGGS
jgi:two-component system, response regulator PdtaR